MKKYMVVCEGNEAVWSKFFDKKSDADQYKMDCECGAGGRAQVYEHSEKKDCYKFLYE